jgi:hypothetical protein
MVDQAVNRRPELPVSSRLNVSGGQVIFTETTNHFPLEGKSLEEVTAFGVVSYYRRSRRRFWERKAKISSVTFPFTEKTMRSLIPISSVQIMPES